MSGERDRKESSPIGLSEVDAAIAYGGAIYSKDAPADFNAAFDHIVGLLDDSVALFNRKSFNTSAFLAITAIEETAKAHVAIYRGDRAEELGKGRDPLRDHRKKHHMAVLPTVFMGGRLTTILGADVCSRLQEEAETDGFITTREASLYCGRYQGSFTTSRMAVSSARAWELLLLALETLDDGLVGYTDHSMAESGRINALFDQIAASKPGK